MKKTIVSILAIAAAVIYSTQAQCTSCQATQMSKTGNIVETASKSGSFNTLVAAVKSAGLAETLSGKGPFTVFAPTDKAFAKLPKGTVESLLKPENKDKLTAILTYHVVPGRVAAKDVLASKKNPIKAKTVNGQQLQIAVTGKKVRVEKANVVKTDVMASNGIIHVIDQVVMPK
jgi:uncharacterized surface protein with fasciclin (FAS1) repeats